MSDTARAMPQENVEIVRTAMEAFNRRDGAALNALLHKDAEIVPVRAAVEGTVFRGADAGEQYCRAVEASWEDLRWDIEDIRQEADSVLPVGRIRGVGRGSGAAIDARAGWVAELRDGRITRFQTYADRADALEAVGRSE
jgi:ketosteroid isomerase-like protein